MAHEFSSAPAFLPFPNCSFQVSQSPPDLRTPRLPPTMMGHPNANPSPCGAPMMYPPAWNNPLSMATAGNLMNQNDSLPLHPLPGGDFLNPTQAILANRIHALLSMADPNLDNRGAEIIENWRQFQQAAIANNLDPNMLALCHSASFDPAGSQRRKNATRETTSTLKAWLKEHRKNPYPTKGEKIMLAILTKMTLTQVSTWFANARRRLKKENKMTWAPRNRTDDDNSDDEAGDDTGIDIEDISDSEIENVNTPPMELKKEKLDENDAIVNKREYPNEKLNNRDVDEEPVMKKPAKIWSIVDTLAIKDDRVKPTDIPSMNPNSYFHNLPQNLKTCPSTPSDHSSASSLFRSPSIFFPNNYPKPGCIPNMPFLQGLPLSNASAPVYFFGGSSQPSPYHFPGSFNPFSFANLSPGLLHNNCPPGSFDEHSSESQRLPLSGTHQDPESQSVKSSAGS